jgi:hypothetical protein
MNIDEARRWFIEASMEHIVTETISQTLEKLNPDFPEYQQGDMCKDIKEQKPNSDVTFYDNNTDAEKDYLLSEMFGKKKWKNFVKIYEDLEQYFNQNTETIKETMIEVFASAEINLIVDT